MNPPPHIDAGYVAESQSGSIQKASIWYVTSRFLSNSVSAHDTSGYPLFSSSTAPTWPIANNLWSAFSGCKRAFVAILFTTNRPRQCHFSIWCSGWNFDNVRRMMTHIGSMRRCVFNKCSMSSACMISARWNSCFAINHFEPSAGENTVASVEM